jgi:hypothetical protein
MTTAALAEAPLAQALAERTLAPTGDARLDAAVEALAAAAGETLVGLSFFGSRRTGAARVDAWSAYDLFVVVTAYRPFYAALRRAGLVRRAPWLLALASRFLPPTQVSLRFPEQGVHIKGSVIDLGAFERETGSGRHDHFCIGRLFQPTLLLGTRDAAARDRLLAALLSALRETWGWSRPWLPPSFDAEGYGRSALATSMQWEVRPEPAGRAEQLWQAQRALQVPVLEALLGELAAAGAVVGAPTTPGLWSPARPVTGLERARRSMYFRLSIVRATARWLKHMVSFEGWLDYIVQKASRHTGEEIRLSERERRFPLVFLWGRVFRHIAETRKGERKRG